MPFESRYRKRLVALLTVALSALLVASFACGGGDDDDDGDDDGGSATPTATENGNGGDGGEVTFDVSMGDNFFEPKEFTVAAGATATFNLTNDGTAIHNMRVAGLDNEYNTDDDEASDPSLINPGESGSIVWTAPDEAGEIDFQCDIHPTDMLGTITVE